MSGNRVPARLLWVVDREAIDNGSLAEAIRGDVRWVQLRDDSIEPSVWRELLEPAGGGLHIVVNGGPAWARQAGWGAHLKAAQPRLSRAQREAWILLGRSVHDVGETFDALRDRPDYLVAGPVFPSGSKPGHPGIGVEGLRRIVEAAAGCPVLAIGGVEAAHAPAIRAAGAYGLALRSGITAAADPVSAARGYLTALPVDPG